MTTAAHLQPRLAGRIVSRESLTSTERDAMFDVLVTFFSGVDRATFERDLAEKSHVILLEDGRRVRGFSTLIVYETAALSHDALVVYSGDTIVDRRWWGSLTLASSWLGAVHALTASAAGDRDAAAREVYWLLLTSGFRTYRFLPVFFSEFCPRYDSESTLTSIADALALERFGDRYDQARGIVRFARPQILIPELLDVPVGRTSDPHVAFFLDRNRGYTEGDELVCLTRVTDDNLTAAGRRIARAARAMNSRFTT